MKNEDLKRAVVSYAKENGVNKALELYGDQVTQNTVYVWMRNEDITYAYTHEECKREFKNIKTKKAEYHARPSTNKITHTFQPHFYHVEKKLIKHPDTYKKIIENRKQYLFKDKFTDRELLRAFRISGIHKGYSHFSPLWIMKFIEDNNIKSIYDPCGGWGHRLIGALASNIHYIYNDKWKKTVRGCEQIYKFLDGTDCTFYNEDCTRFVPEEKYECIFTCPPYYNTEVYENRFKTIKEYEQFIKDMYRYSLMGGDVNIMGIVINERYKNIIIDNNPFNLVSEHELGTTNHISHFNSKRSSVKKELLLTFKN